MNARQKTSYLLLAVVLALGSAAAVSLAQDSDETDSQAALGGQARDPCQRDGPRQRHACRGRFA
jgi:hypothetical protein